MTGKFWFRAVVALYCMMPGLAGAGSGEAPWPTQGWPVAVPAELGMDAGQLAAAREYALSGGGAGLITRGGYQLMAWGDTASRLHLKSATKSLGAAVLGLAVADGLVTLSDPADQCIPGFGVPPEGNAATGWLEVVTLHDLATHTAGFDKAGGYTDQLFAPGTTWAYSDGGANWLADCLTLRYGRDLAALWSERVLIPLGIPDEEFGWRAHWYRETTLKGVQRREFGSGASASADAIARIGYLFLRGGRWETAQLLPRAFVMNVGTVQREVPGLPVGNDTQERFAAAPDHYGLLWWNNHDGSLAGVPADAYWAWGSGDALIVVIPSLDIVATRVGEAWEGDRTPSYYAVLEPFIRPIAESVTGARRGASHPARIEGRLH